MTLKAKRKKKKKLNPLKPKRKGDYGGNKGKKYNVKKKDTEPRELSQDPDEFNVDKINRILEENQKKIDLKNPEVEAAKATVEVDYITIDNDPDEKIAEPEPEPAKDKDPIDPEPDPKEDDPFSLKDLISPDLIIDGLQWLSYKGASVACDRTGKIVPNKAACAYTAKQRELMRPGAEKLMDKLKLRSLEDKPITAMVAIAVIQSVIIVAMASKKPEEPKTE